MLPSVTAIMPLPAGTLDQGRHSVRSSSKERLLDYRRRHAADITHCLRDATASDDPLLQHATTYFLAAEGKYFRPLLTLLCCEVAGGDPEDALELGCAVELAHASSLILDDLPCMDDDSVRRGQPCLHVRFGEAVAILTAVHLLSTAFGLAARADLSGAAVMVLSRAIGAEGLVVGQLGDLAGYGHLDRVRDRKTTPLVCAAAEFGTCAARANARQQAAAVSYARRLGLAFQLRDDVLDREAAPETQTQASALAAEATTDVFEVFGKTPAALLLADLAQFAIGRSA
jgi:geranylgeranyl pyrophosphate synthase